jgi:hypothetical protein
MISDYRENFEVRIKNEEVIKKDVWVPAPCLRLAGAGYNMQGQENYR